MAKQKMRNTLQKYQGRLFQVAPPLREQKGGSKLQHACWMSHMAEHLVQEGDLEAVNRWFGFIQGIMWNHGIYTIDEIRNDNQKMNIPGIRDIS